MPTAEPPNPPSWVNAVEWIANAASGLARLAQRAVVWFDPASFAVTDNATLKRTEVRLAGESFTAEDKFKLDEISPYADVARWSSGMGIEAVNFGSGIYWQIFANKSVGAVGAPVAVINGGGYGITINAVDATAIRIVRKRLDNIGSESTFAIHDNATTETPAMTDVQMGGSAGNVPGGYGLYVKLSISAGTGSDVPPGVTIYLIR